MSQISTLDLAEVRLETFSPLIGQSFAVTRSSSESLLLVLAEASLLAPATSPPHAYRSPFRLIFHGPTNPLQPQGIVSLKHEKLGGIELFLVPIGPVVGEARGAMQYEAIFT